MPENDTRIRNPAGMTDLKPALNQHVNAIIAQSRAAAGGNIARFVDLVYLALGRSPITSIFSINDPNYNKSLVEIWAETQPPTAVFPLPQRSTKFNGVRSWNTASRLTWGPSPTGGVIRVLSPTVLLDGVYMGLDKIGHFMQQGYSYYQIVARQGRPLSDAEQWGHETEAAAGIPPGGGMPQPYGLASTGVYSPADLEANRRGYEFYTWLATNPNTPFDIADYVTDRWSEEVVISSYHEALAPIVWNNLLAGNWTGTYTILNDPNNPSIHLRATFIPGAAAIGGTPLTGQYVYTYTAGQVTTTLAATIRYLPFISAALGYRGIRIDLSWRSGNAVGRGILYAQTSESHLEGTWGRNGSHNDGGRISLKRV